MANENPVSKAGGEHPLISVSIREAGSRALTLPEQGTHSDSLLRRGRGKGSLVNGPASPEQPAADAGGSSWWCCSWYLMERLCKQQGSSDRRKTINLLGEHQV